LTLMVAGTSGSQVSESKAGAPTPAPAANPMAFDAVPAKIDFDVVQFKRCPQGKFGNTKVDMPMDGDYLAYHCETISRLIYFAYNGASKVYTVAGGYPSWVDEERWEFVVKVAPEDIAAWQKLDLSARRVVIRRVLADALKLKIRMETTQQTVYALRADKGGPKMAVYKDGDHTKLPDGRVLDGRSNEWAGVLSYYQDYSMTQLVNTLTAHLDHTVVDQTDLHQFYNFSIPIVPGTGWDPSVGLVQDGESLMEGVRALGLRLESTKAPVERLVIDHIERPEEN